MHLIEFETILTTYSYRNHTQISTTLHCSRAMFLQLNGWKDWRNGPDVTNLPLRLFPGVYSRHTHLWKNHHIFTSSEFWQGLTVWKHCSFYSTLWLPTPASLAVQQSSFYAKLDNHAISWNLCKWQKRMFTDETAQAHTNTGVKLHMHTELFYCKDIINNALDTNVHKNIALHFLQYCALLSVSLSFLSPLGFRCNFYENIFILNFTKFTICFKYWKHKLYIWYMLQNLVGCLAV